MDSGLKDHGHRDDEIDESALLRDTPVEAHKTGNISFPVEDREMMKEQNIRILKELKWFRRNQSFPTSEPDSGEHTKGKVRAEKQLVTD